MNEGLRVKCEAYGEPCKNSATKIVEVMDNNGEWRTMAFCDYCYADFVRDIETDPDFAGKVKYQSNECGHCDGFLGTMDELIIDGDCDEVLGGSPPDGLEGVAEFETEDDARRFADRLHAAGKALGKRGQSSLPRLHGFKRKSD